MNSVWTSIGFISRVHGLKGEVVLEPEFDDADLYDPGKLYYLGKIDSDPVPVRVSNFKLVQKGDQLSFFVKFEHVTDRTDAETIKGFSLFLPSDEVDLDGYDDDITGYNIINRSGVTEGEVVDVIDNPAHPLIQVVGENGAFFIPWVDEFVLDVDYDQRKVIVDDISELKSING